MVGPVMPRWQKAYFAACVWMVVYTLIYAGVTYSKIPHLVYYQIERRFRLQVVGEGVLPSGYVGVWLWALLAGLVSACLAYPSPRDGQTSGVPTELVLVARLVDDLVRDRRGLLHVEQLALRDSPCSSPKPKLDPS
jgi:hypothetical protein